jgi:hypothetical protein
MNIENPKLTWGMPRKKKVVARISPIFPHFPDALFNAMTTKKINATRTNWMAELDLCSPKLS